MIDKLCYPQDNRLGFVLLLIDCLH